MERCNEIRVPSEEAVQLVEYCIQNGYKISTAESCTGGLIAAGIVDVPGASNVFEEGYVTYADRVKQKTASCIRDNDSKVYGGKCAGG